ncbi:hypothetical protein FRB91_010976 [Serendipita sp. 411]|nr:hypothetical protein FRB91_010976 [Serendipita sp. 411]
MTSISVIIKPSDDVMKTKMTPSTGKGYRFLDTVKIDEVKDDIESLDGISASDQVLAWKGNPLPNTKSLRDCGILDGYELQLVYVDSVFVRVHDPDANKPISEFWMRPKDTVQKIKDSMYGAANAGNYFANLNGSRLKETDTISPTIPSGSHIYMVSNVHGG